jgi:hypothetical protein
MLVGESFIECGLCYCYVSFVYVCNYKLCMQLKMIVIDGNVGMYLGLNSGGWGMD